MTYDATWVNQADLNTGTVSAGTPTLDEHINTKGYTDTLVAATSASIINSGITIAAEWRFDSSTTASDPGSGKFRLDNITPQVSASNIYINDDTEQDVDMGLLISKLALGDAIYIQERKDSSRALLFEVNGSPTDNTGWWTIPITNGVSSINDLENGEKCGFLFQYSGSALPHSGLTGLIAPADDHTQYSHIDGRRAFTNPVSGSTPTLDEHLTTKLYVDTPPITGSSDYYQMTVSAATPGHSEGLFSWDDNDHTLRIFNDIPAMAIQVGQEVIIRVRNETGVQIDDGTPVRGVGSSQGLITVTPSQGNSLNNLRTTGIATHNIPNNTNGYITIIGQVRDIDTSAWSGGDTLYVSPTAAGELTDIRPKSPNIAHAIATVSISDATSGSIFAFSSPARTDPMQEIAYTLPLTGVVDTSVDFIGTLRNEALGATGDVATDWAVSNQHVFIYINSITGSGDITITGTSLPEASAVPSAGDVEVLPASATGYLQTDRKWWEVTNIDVETPAISAIDFDYGVVGYPDMGNRNFRIIGYRCDAYATGNSPDFRLIIEKVDDTGGKNMDIVLLEDIGVDSGAIGNQIIDHLRIGADDRSYDPAVTDIWDNDTTFTFKQLDFNDYFADGVNDILGGDHHEGYIIRIEGEGGGITNVDFITIHLFYELI